MVKSVIQTQANMVDRIGMNSANSQSLSFSNKVLDVSSIRRWVVFPERSILLRYHQIVSMKTHTNPHESTLAGSYRVNSSTRVKSTYLAIVAELKWFSSLSGLKHYLHDKTPSVTYSAVLLSNHEITQSKTQKK